MGMRASSDSIPKVGTMTGQYMNAFAKRDSISLFHSESEERIAKLALPLGSKCAFLEGQTIKNPPAMLETWV